MTKEMTKDEDARKRWDHCRSHVCEQMRKNGSRAQVERVLYTSAQITHPIYQKRRRRRRWFGNLMVRGSFSSPSIKKMDFMVIKARLAFQIIWLPQAIKTDFQSLLIRQVYTVLHFKSLIPYDALVSALGISPKENHRFRKHLFTKRLIIYCV